MTTSAVKNNFLPPGLVSNLQEVLLNRKGAQNDKDQQSKPKDDDPSTQSSSSDLVPDVAADDADSTKPVVLVTNADGIESPGLTVLLMLLFVKVSVMLMSALPNQINRWRAIL